MEVSCLLLQGIFLIQGSNLPLLHWPLPLRHQGNPPPSPFFFLLGCYNSCSKVLVCEFQHLSLLVQFSLVTQSCPTLSDPMDCSTPGFPVHHQIPELAQTHVHRVSDAIQPSHLLSSSSLPAFNHSQHQGLFQ